MGNIIFFLLFVCGAFLVLGIACLIADRLAMRAAERRLNAYLDKQFKPVGDGMTDDTEAVQRTLDHAYATKTNKSKIC